ncbi:MAG: hypothetical protein Q6373_006010 [Candidatus Sigynarchaeota archaeon]
MANLPRITWYDYRGKKTPYQMFMEAIESMGEGVKGIFTTWLAKQTTCEYMLWNYIVDFYETGDVVQEDTEFSAKGNEIHNLLAFGTTESLMEKYRDGKSYLQWRNFEELHRYQQQRLSSTYKGKITEYALVGEITGLKVRGTFDALDLDSGMLIEIKTRARPTLPYVHERKNKMQLLTYYFLVKNYNKELNDPGFPVHKLSDYAKIQYYHQTDQRLLGEIVIHVPYEAERYLKAIDYFKEFWMGKRRPTFSLKYCIYCRFTNSCYYHKKFYRQSPRKPDASNLNRTASREEE